MPFKLYLDSATYQRTLDEVIGLDLDMIVFAYLDVIVALGNILRDHARNLRTVFNQLMMAKHRVNIYKCWYVKTGDLLRKQQMWMWDLNTK